MLLALAAEHWLHAGFVGSGEQVYHAQLPERLHALAFLFCAFFLVYSLAVCMLSVGASQQASLLVYHSYLILTNQTTWEQTSHQKINYLNVYPDKFLPFDKGPLLNVLDACCPGKSFKRWELPDVQSAWERPQRATCLNNKFIHVIC